MYLMIIPDIPNLDAYYIKFGDSKKVGESNEARIKKYDTYIPKALRKSEIRNADAGQQPAVDGKILQNHVLKNRFAQQGGTEWFKIYPRNESNNIDKVFEKFKNLKVHVEPNERIEDVLNAAVADMKSVLPDTWRY